MHQLLTWELVYCAEFPEPKKKTIEDVEQAPVNIDLDRNANFRL
jgi:hypothetical protein